MYNVGSEKVMYGAVEVILASRQRRPVAPQVPDEDLDGWMEQFETAINEWKIEVTARRDDSLGMDVHSNDDEEFGS
jgi:hypothetical protein